jgi:hypothetical protein
MKKIKPIQPKKKSVPTLGWAAKTDIARLTVNVPRKHYNRFKSLTAERGDSITDVINTWVEEYIQKGE